MDELSRRKGFIFGISKKYPLEFIILLKNFLYLINIQNFNF